MPDNATEQPDHVRLCNTVDYVLKYWGVAPSQLPKDIQIPQSEDIQAAMQFLRRIGAGPWDMRAKH